MDMLSWLHHVAQWAAPIAQILAIPTAIVTFFITVRRVRRWITERLDDILGIAQKAESNSKVAAVQATQSSEQSRSADEAIQAANAIAQDANKAVLWMADTVRKALDQNEQLLVRLEQRAADDHEPPRGLLIPRDAGDDDDPATVTGRHRLHTQRIPTDQGDPE